MGSVGKVAFIAILGLGAITGVLVYYVFGDATPAPGIMESIYRQNLTSIESSTNATSSTSTNVTSSAPPAGTAGTAGVSLTILEGSSVQGNPSYDPDPLAVTAGDVIEVTNEDNVPHTVTSGTGLEDPESGVQFDTSIIDAGGTAQVDTANLATGEYPYYCSVHPYMLGTLTVE